MNYQLQNLSPPEFTELVGDLVSSDFAVTLSKSPDGPDGGIDLLRAGETDRPDIIVQCKHYSKSTYSHLKRDLRLEVEKIRRLRPHRYVIATSMELTVSQKKDVLALFEGYILSLDDVLGGQDVSASLRRNPKVERDHYKLWLGSTELLARVIHQGTNVWHNQLMSHIRDHKQVYVQTPSFGKALEILNEHKIVLIAGGPGIGKTTLANVIAARCVAEGFQFREIVDLEQPLKDVPDEGNVVFYFDDFLGYSVWRDNQPGSEKRLQSLLRLCQQDSRFWLILTTRTYLLEDAKRLSSAVEERLGQQLQVVLHIDEMSRRTRARIIYNHLFFNGVPPEACKSFTDWDVLEKILNHPNYSPRIIEAVTRSLPSDLLPSDCSTYLIKQLDNPDSLYRAAIEERIGAEARDLLFVLHVLGGFAHLDHLYRVWKDLTSSLSKQLQNRRLFNSKLKSLEGSLVKINGLVQRGNEGPREACSFYNPAVREQVVRVLWQYDEHWKWLCESAESGSELVNLARCHPDAKTVSPWEVRSVKLPESWYQRWFSLAISARGQDADLVTSLSSALSLNIWNGDLSRLQELLSLLAETHGERWIHWSGMGEARLPSLAVNCLSRLNWLDRALVEEVKEFLQDEPWDDEEPAELYERLENLGPVAYSAQSVLQDRARDYVRKRISSLHADEEISEEDYYAVDHLNESLHLSLDHDVLALFESVRYSSSVSSSNVNAPKLGDDSMSTAEVKALFLSLCSRESEETQVR